MIDQEIYYGANGVRIILAYRDNTVSESSIPMYIPWEMTIEGTANEV